MLLLPLPGWAGRPLVSDDAGVIAPGGCELEAFGSYARARPDPAQRGGRVQLGCGVAPHTQLAIGVGRFGSVEAWDSTATLSGKTALHPLSGEDVGVALAYALDAVAAAGQRWRHSGSSATLVVSVPFAGTLLHANLGLARNTLDGSTAHPYALAVERLGEQGIDVGVELFGQRGESPWLGAGLRAAVVRDRLFVDLSLAQQRGSSGARQVTVGLKAAF